MCCPSKTVEFPLHLNVLIEKRNEGEFVAHCLELDLVAGGSTQETAFDELINLVDVQVRTCVKDDDIDNLFFPAPKEYWDKLAHSRSSTPQYRYARHKRPMSKSTNGFTIMEVDELSYV